jgi:hypothetical protein
MSFWDFWNSVDDEKIREWKTARQNVTHVTYDTTIEWLIIFTIDSHWKQVILRGQ